MMTVLQTLHFAAALVVLAEALNKLERAHPLRAGLSLHMRVVDWLKTIGWAALAMGAGSVVFAALLASSEIMTWLRPLTDNAVLIGFALLIIRTRVREGLSPYQRRQEDKTS